jgi:hypothetical protein
VYLRFLNPPLDDAEDEAEDEDATAAVVDASTGGGAGVAK